MSTSRKTSRTARENKHVRGTRPTETTTCEKQHAFLPNSGEEAAVCWKKEEATCYAVATLIYKKYVRARKHARAMSDDGLLNK
jgi:hypothetical protein